MSNVCVSNDVATSCVRSRNDERMVSAFLTYLICPIFSWEFNETFYNQPNWQRIMVSGGTTDPPLEVQVHAGPGIQDANQAFSYDRHLAGRQYETHSASTLE